MLFRQTQYNKSTVHILFKLCLNFVFGEYFNMRLVIQICYIRTTSSKGSVKSNEISPKIRMKHLVVSAQSIYNVILFLFSTLQFHAH